MDEAHWSGIKKHMAVYMVEVYCCKLCNDFSSTHKSLVLTHMHDVHLDEAMEAMKAKSDTKDEQGIQKSSEEDISVQLLQDDSNDEKEMEVTEEESEELVIARQVAENEQIQKSILQMLHAAGNDVGKEENKENKQSRKKKKKKKTKKGQKEKEEPRRKNKRMCKICNHITDSSDELNIHMMTHYEDPESRSCESCEAAFDTYEELIKHSRKCLPNPQVYKCSECGKMCNDKRAIIEHMVVHSEARPYSCNICGKAYKTKKILRRHEGIHEMSRDVFQCPDCKFKTHWKTNIKRHIMEVHKKDSRPLFSCPHCPFSTPNRRYLEKHKFGHWKDCPYMCENCGKMFRSELELENHKHTHDIQPDVAWQLIQLQNSEPQLVEESIVQYQPQIQMHGQEIQIQDHESGLQGHVQVTVSEQDDATKTIVLSQIPVVQYLDIVSGQE